MSKHWMLQDSKGWQAITCFKALQYSRRASRERQTEHSTLAAQLANIQTTACFTKHFKQDAGQGSMVWWRSRVRRSEVLTIRYFVLANLLVRSRTTWFMLFIKKKHLYDQSIPKTFNSIMRKNPLIAMQGEITHITVPVLPLKPKYRLAHPKNH